MDCTASISVSKSDCIQFRLYLFLSAHTHHKNIFYKFIEKVCERENFDYVRFVFIFYAIFIWMYRKKKKKEKRKRKKIEGSSERFEYTMSISVALLWKFWYSRDARKWTLPCDHGLLIQSSLPCDSLHTGFVDFRPRIIPSPLAEHWPHVFLAFGIRAFLTHLGLESNLLDSRTTFE